MRISLWSKLLRMTAWVMRWIKIVRKRVNKTNFEEGSPTQLHVLSVEELIAAEVVAIKGYQKTEFKEEFVVLDGCRNKKLKASIGCWNPYVGEDGLIRVGGRLQLPNLDEKVMHPAILPKKGKLTEMIIRWCHQKTIHSGRNVTLNEIRTSGYWVFQGNSAVKEMISRYVTYRRLRGKVGKQIVADLPQDRLKEEPPFTYYGGDMFGPSEIKERRNTLKRYGTLFTCLESHAIHIEMTKSTDTDSFILVLWCFTARHGNRSIRCDNGSNFIREEKELEKYMNEMYNKRIRDCLLEKRAGWIVWKKNSPKASHMGGVWERQIRSAKIILSSLIKTHSMSLNEESLSTLFAEVKAIVNSRPMVVKTINDVNNDVAISPSHILTMKSKVAMPPPGVFGKPDLYS